MGDKISEWATGNPPTSWADFYFLCFTQHLNYCIICNGLDTRK